MREYHLYQNPDDAIPVPSARGLAAGLLLAAVVPGLLYALSEPTTGAGLLVAAVAATVARHARR